MKIVIAAARKWTLAKAEFFEKTHNDIEVHLIRQPAELTGDLLYSIAPDYVFFPHWSWYIPPEIYNHFLCIVFHPSDLPFGRGGSPIQNLIAEGVKSTKISAIEVAEEMDSGGVFLKRDLPLLGTGEEIYLRIQDIIFNEMIPFIIEKKPIPVPQSGIATVFKRRTPEMSELNPKMTITQLYDTIRMLDAEGYPHAFLDFGAFRITFTHASMKTDGIIADVTITQKGIDGTQQ